MPAVLHFLETADEDSYASDLRKAILEKDSFSDNISIEKNFVDWFDNNDHDAYSGWLSRWLSGYQNVLTDNGPKTWNVSVYRTKCAVRHFFSQN